MRTDVANLYVALFGRAPERDGLGYWVQQLDAGKTVAEVAQEMYNTEPARATYPTFLTNEEVIGRFYTNVLGRTADADGLAYWTAKLNAGQSKGSVIGEMITAVTSFTGTGTDALSVAARDSKALFTNKVTVGLYYAVDLGGNDVSKASTILTNVTKEAASVDAAKQTASTAVGQTYALTQGLDTVTGTAQNDKINAFAFNGATGTDVTTLNTVDTIDGGAGTDTLYIEVKDADGAGAGTANLNGTIQGTIKNVEIINIDNTAAHATGMSAVDASKFQGATEVTQIAKAADVTNLAATTTAGFKNTAQAAALSVAGAATAATVNVKLDGVADADKSNGNTVVLNVSGEAANTVNVSGSIAAGTNTPATQTLTVNVTTGKDQKTIAVNSSIDATVTIAENAGNTAGVVVTAVNLSGSTGGITFVGDADAATITSGSGKDDITVKTTTAKDNTGTAADETVNASVNTGAGDDIVEVDVTGDGKTTVTSGAGNDTVYIKARGTSALTVDMGDGADVFTSDVSIAATDVIDAGAGSDTLLLSLVGAANVGAFKNFDVFDVNAMTTNLDLDILNANNTVSEIVASAALGGNVTLQNVGAGVGFRATGDMGTTNVLTLTQKTAGALTVALDADETGTADAGDDVAGMSIAAAGATSVTATFDTAYLGAAGAVAGETAATDNVSTIALATQAATSISVVSGGANSKNVLNVTEGAGTDALATVTATGAQALTLSVSGASKLATIDASAATGGLTASLSDLKADGTIKLGTGIDTITVAAAGSNATAVKSIVGFEKTAAVAVSVAAGDAVAKAAAIADADKVVMDAGANEAVANASTSALAATLANGVLTFTGAGPATLDAALVIADDFAETAGESLAFEFLGNTYVFTQGATHAVGTPAATAADALVKLVGVTGVTNLVETGTDTFFLV